MSFTTISKSQITPALHALRELSKKKLNLKNFNSAVPNVVTDGKKKVATNSVTGNISKKYNNNNTSVFPCVSKYAQFIAGIGELNQIVALFTPPESILLQVLVGGFQVAVQVIDLLVATTNQGAIICNYLDSLIAAITIVNTRLSLILLEPNPDIKFLRVASLILLAFGLVASPILNLFSLVLLEEKDTSRLAKTICSKNGECDAARIELIAATARLAIAYAPSTNALVSSVITALVSSLTLMSSIAEDVCVTLLPPFFTLFSLHIDILTELAQLFLADPLAFLLLNLDAIVFGGLAVPAQSTQVLLRLLKDLCKKHHEDPCHNKHECDCVKKCCVVKCCEPVYCRSRCEPTYKIRICQ